MEIVRDWLKNLKRKDLLGDMGDNIKMVLKTKWCVCMREQSTSGQG
jgi:hypothetical protein